ncbi:four helix bundle protein [Anaerolineae bacterium CFX7]|nr:four helix bundle protein [Anaerolineae bacterium CFX7]
MTSQEMKARTKKFAVRVIKMTETLPDKRAANIIANQLIRSATSVGANYRAALRARSQADFISKIGITTEESDESEYWMELLVDCEIVKPERIADLLQEANELVAIFTATSKTTKSHSQRYPKS